MLRNQICETLVSNISQPQRPTNQYSTSTWIVYVPQKVFEIWRVFKTKEMTNLSIKLRHQKFKSDYTGIKSK